MNKVIDIKATKDSMLGMAVAYTDAANIIQSLRDFQSENKEHPIYLFLSSVIALMEDKAKKSIARALNEFPSGVANDNITRH